MKKILYVLGIVLILSSCNGAVYKKTDDGRNVQIMRMDVTPIHNIRYVEFDEHEYVYYQGGHQGSMCHSPKCKCLKEDKK